MSSSNPAPNVAQDAARNKPASAVGATAVIRSEALLGGRPQLGILHNDELYFLRLTRLGKLILTK